MATHTITLSQSNWTGGTATVYFDDVSRLFYADSALATEITQVTPPTRECYRLNGFYSANSTTDPGTLYINADGTFTDDFWSMCIGLTGTTTNVTIYVNGSQVSWKLTISPNGGTGGTTALYYKIDDPGYYTGDLCDGSPVTSITRPTKSANAFKGGFSSTSSTLQYIDKDGNFTSELTSLQLTAAKTIYAQWKAGYKITVSANSGTGGTTAFYYDSLNGVFFDSTDFTTTPITKIVPHTRECYLMLGYMATNADAGVLRVYADGTIVSGWTPTAAATIYCRWQIVSYKITITKNSGTGGTDAFYYKAATSPKEYYSDDQCTTAITKITPPTRSAYSFKGVYSSTSSTVQYIDKDGNFTATLEELSITANKTFYAQWCAVYTITLDRKTGTGGTSVLYYDTGSTSFYFDESLTQQATALASLPTQECYDFTGFWSAASGGTQYITADGAFTAALTSLSITANKTFHAQYSRVSYKVTLDGNGGTGGDAAIYNNGTTATFYSDDHCTTVITSVTIPANSGHSFIGYFSSTTGGTKYINEDGTIIVAVAITADVTVHARWTANTYTLSFDADGGTPSPSSISVTYGQAIGTLPTVTKSGCAFDGWKVETEIITAATVWNFTDDKQARAEWDKPFGGVKDYFGLGSSALIPESSESGDTHRHECAYNATSETATTETSGIWRNPRVTYRLAADCTINVTLGKAYAANYEDGIMTISGFMIAAVEIRTAVGEPPQVTVSGVANEGADAIQTYPLTFSVSARHRPQNLMSAISGGGDLQDFTLTAKCDPVVVAENGMPCASDVCHGSIEVSATTAAYADDVAPTAGTGFVRIAEPLSKSGTGYKTWNVTMRKEI